MLLSAPAHSAPAGCRPRRFARRRPEESEQESHDVPTKRKVVSSSDRDGAHRAARLLALAAGPASADPVCDVPIPPPVCGVEPAGRLRSRQRRRPACGATSTVTRRPTSRCTAARRGPGTRSAARPAPRCPPYSSATSGRTATRRCPGISTRDGKSDHGVFSRYSISTVSFGKYFWRSSISGAHESGTRRRLQRLSGAGRLRRQRPRGAGALRLVRDLARARLP